MSGYADMGCCEIIAEMLRMLRELKSRPRDEFDKIDRARLVRIAKESCEIALRLVDPEDLPLVFTE